jgi:hypothetical protein
MVLIARCDEVPFGGGGGGVGGAILNFNKIKIFS